MSDFKPRDMSQYFRGCMIASIAGVALGGLALFLGALNNFRGEELGVVFLAGLLLLGCALAAAAAGAAYRKRRASWLMHIALVGLFIGSILIVWAFASMRSGDSEELASIGGALFIGGCAIALTGLFLSFDADTLFLKILRAAVPACAWLAAGCVIYSLFYPVFFGFGNTPFDDLIAIGVALFPLLTAIGTIAAPIVFVSRAARGASASETLAEGRTLSLGCPQCGRRQDAPVGPSRCVSCRTRLFIEIEEPRCACGYILYRLTSATCPECGLEIPPEFRAS